MAVHPAAIPQEEQAAGGPPVPPPAPGGHWVAQVGDQGVEQRDAVGPELRVAAQVRGPVQALQRALLLQLQRVFKQAGEVAGQTEAELQTR